MDNLVNSLKSRVLCLFADMVLLWLAFALTSGRFLPTGGLESVWLLSAIAYLFFRLVSSPWFAPPRDALANAVGASAILVTLDLGGVRNVGPYLDLLRYICIAYTGVASICAVVALVLHDDRPGSPIALAAFRTSTVLGKGEVLYTPPAIISIIGSYQDAPVSMGILLTLWVIFLTAKPVERFASIFAALTKAREDKVSAPDVGTIERIDYPNIVRVKLAKGAAWNSGTLYIAGVCDGEVRYTLALFRQIQGAEVIGTGLCIATADPTKTLPVGRVRASHDAELAAQFIEKLSGSPGAELVGFTVENSNIGIIRFEIASDSPLSEGDVVFASIRQQDIFYQIIDAETAEESFDQNPRGTCIIRAAQLGSYSPEKGFVKFPWVPSMNSPLFWAKKCEFLRPHLNPSEFLVGDVPSTNISVVADLNHLVEYHTAVLGVTGTGKTELALDIVREAVSRNTKVFCVDFTGEYKARLADLHPTSPTPTEDQVADLEKKLFEAETGAYGAGQEKRILKEAISSIKGEVEQQISDFLVKEDDRLAILELGEIANTKATLRLTELYLSSIMMWARRHRKARQILIVLEEAHTIIPETHGAGFDFDTQWVVSRIGQIALQGRKIWGWSSDRQPADRACE